MFQEITSKYDLTNLNQTYFDAMTSELRQAGSPIRVTALSPADTATEFTTHLFGSEKEAKKRRSDYLPMEADDIAEAILYILSTPQNVEIHDILLRPINQPD